MAFTHPANQLPCKVYNSKDDQRAAAHWHAMGQWLGFLCWNGHARACRLLVSPSRICQQLINARLCMVGRRNSLLFSSLVFLSCMRRAVRCVFLKMEPVSQKRCEHRLCLPCALCTGRSTRCSVDVIFVSRWVLVTINFTEKNGAYREKNVIRLYSCIKDSGHHCPFPAGYKKTM